MSVYLDHAAGSPLRPEALEAFTQAAGVLGNPSALHRDGQRARSRLEEAREELAEALGAEPTEVIFTSGGSEADTLGVLGGWRARRVAGRERLLVSAVEHPAVAQAREHGAGVLPVGADGIVDLEAAARLIDDSAALVSVQWVGNETGIIQPLDELRELTARAGAWLHSDAVQALGHVAVDFRASGLDLLSISGHKVGAPVGIGALLARRDATPQATGLGGGQERGIRSGTVPVALAAALARAATCAVGEQGAEAARLRALSGRIAALCAALGARLNSHADGASHIVNATFPGTRADDLLFLLDQRGIRASVGSACRAGVHQPSEVLLAMGRSTQEASGSLRFSLGYTSTPEDVAALERFLPEALTAAQAAFVSGVD